MIFNYPFDAALRKDKGSWDGEQNKTNVYNYFLHDHFLQNLNRPLSDYFLFMVSFHAKKLTNSFYCNS